MTPPTLTCRGKFRCWNRCLTNPSDLGGLMGWLGKFRCWNRCLTNPSDHQGSLVMRSLAQICFLHLKRLHPKRKNPNLLLNLHQRGMLESLIKSPSDLTSWENL